jgi:hypothetical protein
MVRPLMVSCKNEFEKALEQHKEMGDYPKYHHAYQEMIRDYAKAQMEKWVKDNMINSREGHKYFKCKWSVPGKPTIDHTCEYGELELDSGSLRYELVDPDGFYDQVNQTMKVTKSMISFEGKEIRHMLMGGTMDLPDPEDTGGGGPGAQKGDGIEGSGMARQDLVGLPSGNPKLEVDNPMLQFKNLTAMMADTHKQLFEHQMMQYDLHLDDHPGADIAYSLCYWPIKLTELAKHIDEVIHEGWKYDNEVLEPKRKKEKLKRILGVINYVIDAIAVVAAVFTGGGSLLARFGARAVTGAVELGLTRLPPQFAMLTGQLSARGAGYLTAAGNAANIGAMAAVAGGLPVATVLGVESGEWDEFMGFMANLLIPAGLMVAFRAERWWPKAEQRPAEIAPKGFDMEVDAGPLATKIKDNVAREGGPVAERMGGIEHQLKGWGTCKL